MTATWAEEAAEESPITEVLQHLEGFSRMFLELEGPFGVGRWEERESKGGERKKGERVQVPRT